ncbi:MAG: ABC transporter ATP-binding protein [Treponema sp.]|jgi:peptide/nickel transport system ATP-binding protein|nr:ABC transporter ATP-binding protein [Treponema sp.]
MAETVLEVQDLSVTFRMYDQGLEQRDLRVIHRLNLSVKEGEILAAAGSSGSGKSLLAHAILGILPGNAKTTGEMRYYGQTLTPALQKKLRGAAMALVPQSVEYLDPLMRVETQVLGVRGSREKQRALFQRYRLPETAGKLFPFQLSGGMARRVLVAAAAMEEPKLIIADEPTPGMGAAMARTAMGHFQELARAGAAVLLITHDLDLAFTYADRIAVFYAGTTLETAPAEDFRTGQALRHPYSRALWAAVPQHGFIPAPGRQPYAASLGEGCPYAPRCHQKTEICEKPVPMRPLRGGEVACVHAL